MDSVTLNCVTRVTTLLAPYSWRQLIKFNCNFDERKLFIAFLSDCSIVHTQTHPEESSRLRPLRHCHQRFHNDLD